MRKPFLIFSSFLTIMVLAGCQLSGYKWFKGSFDDAKAIAHSKLILLDFYTDT